MYQFSMVFKRLTLP